MNRFLVLGSLNIDTVFSVDHIVQPGETISSIAVKDSPGGKGANQAAALAKAGATVSFAGKISNDGKWILEILASFGVDVSRTIVSAQNRTGQAMIQVDIHGQNSIVLNPGGNKCFTEQDVDKMIDGFGEGDYIVLQNEINLTPYAISKAKEKGMIVVLNPSPFDPCIFSWPLDLVDYFFVNEIEAGQLLGGGETGYDSLARSLALKYPSSAFVLTVGKLGAYYVDSKQLVYSPIFDLPVLDTTGAGDTFCGYFLRVITQSFSPEDALKQASKAAGITVSRYGAMESIPYGYEILDQLD